VVVVVVVDVVVPWWWLGGPSSRGGSIDCQYATHRPSLARNDSASGCVELVWFWDANVTLHRRPTVCRPDGNYAFVEVDTSLTTHAADGSPCVPRTTSSAWPAALRTCTVPQRPEQHSHVENYEKDAHDRRARRTHTQLH
jgi:hypothetical protein